jgi:triacylglycerol lipase
MLQYWLRILLGAELGGYMVLGWWMHSRGESGLAIACAIVLIGALWRISHATGSFVVASILRWREGRREPAGTAWAAWAGEFSARLISFNWSQPFSDFVMGPDPVVPGHGIPILLVHGYFSNRGMWCRFRQRMHAAGIGPVFTIDLEPPFASINTFAAQLAKRIDDVCESNGAAKVFVIAHSMGGLVTRAYIQRDGRQRISGFVSLGSPHHGSTLAVLGLGACVRQIRPRSDWLNELEQGEITSTLQTPPTWSIYTTNDDLVYPPEMSRLSWANNIAVDGVGHVGLLFSSDVFAIVQSILNDQERLRQQ